MKIQIIIDQPTSEFLALLASLPLDGTVEVHPVVAKQEPKKKSISGTIPVTAVTPQEIKAVEELLQTVPTKPEQPKAQPSITFESVRTWITEHTKGETEADEALRVKIKAALVKYIPETEPKKTLSKLPTEHLEAFYHDITN